MARHRLALFALLVALLLAAYAAAGVWLAPRLISERLSDEVARRGHRLSIESLHLNPFSFTLEANGVKLERGDGSFLFSLQQLRANFALLGLLSRTWRFDEIAFTEPRANVSIAADGKLNWSDLLATFPKKEDDQAGPRLVFDRIRIERGAIALSDRSRGEPVEQNFAPIDADLQQLSSVPNSDGNYVLSAALSGGGTLAWTGNLSLNPLGSKGKMEVLALPLATLWRVAKPWDALQVKDGSVRASANYDWNGRLGQLGIHDLSLRLENANGTLLTEPRTPVSLALLQVSAGHFALPGARVRFGALEVAGLALRAPSLDAPLIQLAGGKASDFLVDPPARLIRAGSLTLTARQATVEIAPDGRITLPRFAESKPAKPAATPSPKPWRYEVAKLDVQSQALSLSDRRSTPVAGLQLHDFALAAQNLAYPGGKPFPVSASVAAKPSGTLSVKGTVGLEPLAGSLELQAEALALAPFQPLLSQYAHLRIVSGSASARGQLSFGAGQESAPWYQGSLALADVSLEETQGKTPFVAWKNLEARETRLGPRMLQIRELLAVRPSGKLIIEPDRNINLSRVLKTGDRDTKAGKGSAAGGARPPADKPDSGFAAAVQRIRIQDGELDFADLSLRPQFSAKIHHLAGTINGLSTDRRSAARLQLDGQVDEFGSARIRGQINVFAPAVLTDVNMVFRNLDMATFSPYTVRFAGYAIASGKLNADLRYRVRNGEVEGDNRLVMEQLKLGPRMESAGALNIPIDLALALLKDPQGRIDIAIPVRGNLNDPQFSYGEIIAKTIGSILSRVVTAPFRLLAGLAGGKEDEMQGISFDPGSAALPPPEREKLMAVAKGMAERPQVALRVQGGFDPEADGRALKRVALRRELANRIGLKLSPEEDPGALDPTDPQTRRAAEALFTQRYDLPALRKLRADVEAQTAGKDEAERGRALGRALYSRLVDDTPLGPDALQRLAQNREAAVRETLITSGVQGERVLADSPAATRADKEGVPTPLKLVAQP
jgi:hypothetical protein